MTPAAAVTLAALLFALLCILVGSMVWQEAQRRPGSPSPTYVIEDAVAYISGRLSPEVRDRIGVAGVRRIIEWEVYYLQGLAQKGWRVPVESVAGGSDASIDYIQDRIAVVNGATYDRNDISEVLQLEVAYLDSIGVIGDPVTLDDDEHQGGSEA